MAKVSAYLLEWRGEYGHWCPGCEQTHWIATARPNRPSWSFNGDVNAPTFNPSVRIQYEGPDAGQTDADGFRSPPACCHYFLHAGQIQFCADSTHALAGQTVPLPLLPA